MWVLLEPGRCAHGVIPGLRRWGSSQHCEDWFSSMQQIKRNLVFSTFWASPLNPPGQSPTGSKQKLEVEGLSILPLLSVWFCGGYESYANLFVQEIPLYFFKNILNLSRSPHPSSWRNSILIIAWLSPPLSLMGPERLRYSQALPGLVFLGCHRAVWGHLLLKAWDCTGLQGLSPWLEKVLISLLVCFQRSLKTPASLCAWLQKTVKDSIFRLWCLFPCRSPWPYC